MKKEIKEVWENVKANALNKSIRNYRDLKGEIKEGTLIVMGFDERENPFPYNRAYAIMGIYKGGNIGYASLENYLEFYNMKDGSDISSLTYDKECEMETANWWRIPTDDEIKLYGMIYEKYGLLKDFDNFINEVENEELNNDEILETLCIFKDLIEKLN
jgi:hypothetical protein